MKQIQIAFLVTSALLSSSLYADDLMQVYHQAVVSDPVFAQAQSSWQSQKMNLPIAEAGYLPQVSLAANADRDYTNPSPAQFGALSGYTWQYGYQLTLSQPIFNFAAWAAIKGASASVKAATASYLSAQQSLIQRTATAYFAVLQAYDQLRYTIANKRAVWQQYVMAREQFRVGLIAITDEYDARSRYDQVLARQISSQNNLNIQLENLRAITGQSYQSLNGIGRQLPLLRPQPDNIDRWVDVANEQNYAIKAQNYTVQAAMATIKQQSAAGDPSLSIQGGYSDAHTTENPVNNVGVPNTTGLDQANLGLALAYAPIQGGRVIASTKQARYDYVTASGKLEQTHRDVVDKTRSSFFSVLSFIGQVNADKQSIVSAKNAVAATEAGFRVGTRTMVDVLNDLSTLYQTQQQYANDQYAYINNLIALKAAAGTLSVADLQKINTWLGKRLRFTQQTTVEATPNPNEKTDLENASAHPAAPVKKVTKKTATPIVKKPAVNALPPVQPASPMQLDAPRRTMLPRPDDTV